MMTLSERNLCSCQAIEVVAKESPEEFWDFDVIRTDDFCDIGATLPIECQAMFSLFQALKY